jgi:hypothetical protein
MRAMTMTMVAAVAALAAAASAQESLSRVEVVNFPAVQQIDGKVEIDGPIPTASAVRFQEVVVTPVDRTATTRLLLVGSVATEGFAWATISLAGEIKGTTTRAGTVGAVLVPAEEPVQRALTEDGIYLFPLEAAAPVATGERGWVVDQKSRLSVGFPRYNLYLYNSTDKSVGATVWVYLSSS